MIHIGTIHLSGHGYSFDLNRSNRARNDSSIEPSGTVLGRNFPTVLSEITLLHPKWKIDRAAALNLVSRFLSWCLPVREFKSPLQRVLYLSIEGPKTKYRKRLLLP